MGIHADRQQHGLVLACLRAGLVRGYSSKRGHSKRKPEHEDVVQTLYVHERTENHAGDKVMREVQEGCVCAWELTSEGTVVVCCMAGRSQVVRGWPSLGEAGQWLGHVLLGSTLFRWG